MQKQNSAILKKLDRITKEAEILSLMEESNKNKEWIKRQIKKKSLKIVVKLSMNSFQILKSCPDSFINDLLDTLKGRDLDDLGDIDSFTKTFFWFFTDIVAGSNPTIASKDKFFFYSEKKNKKKYFKIRFAFDFLAYYTLC